MPHTPSSSDIRSLVAFVKASRYPGLAPLSRRGSVVELYIAHSVAGFASSGSIVDRNDWKALFSDGDSNDMGPDVELSDRKSVGDVCARTRLEEILVVT